jgi:hypothetical protein
VRLSPTQRLGAPCPDFLWRLVALIHSVRLSLMKGAHADLSSAAWQEIGVKPGFGLSGIPQHSTRLFSSSPCTHQRPRVSVSSSPSPSHPSLRR